jgi:uncharacterized membrane protein YqgA involved in biofilm formation
MVGTLINVAGILAGATAGLIRKKGISPSYEAFLKVAIATFTIFYGLRLTWVSINGSFLQVLRQILIVIVALMLGKICGRLMRLQKFSNRLGGNARSAMEAASKGIRTGPGDGFKVCAVLFCAAPLGILGALQDGLSDYFYPLIVKGVVDGLAAMGFAMMFGWGVMLSVISVLAFQGTIYLAASQWLRPLLEMHHLVDPINAVGGLLVFCVGLIVLQLKKIEIADYLPSLAIAPLLTWFFR